MRTAAILVLAMSLGACASRTRHLPAHGALGPYSAAVFAERFCFVSGKIGATRETFAAEADAAIDALERDLARGGLALADVVSVTVYLTDMALYPELNTVYARRFPDPYPARACVAVAALPTGARVEIQAVARRAN